MEVEYMTLRERANKEIGEKARIIVVKMGKQFIPLVNPQIISYSKATYVK